ncbi:MAG: glutamate-1-semialdehyde-2,1-aminomutase [Bacteroidetes bacterium]|nr:MAG: glutamate-1-semialdehyde-2,1-aminomutase [Bacteroidota bacterium]
MPNTPISQELFAKAQTIIPGGVNSPVRAFKAVGGNPIFMKSAKGAYLHDEDGNQYIELINSWGPMILGHANPVVEEAVMNAIKNSFSFGAPTRKEVEMAELIIEMMPFIDKIRMVNSGTEATMSAIRVARGFTGKDKIIKFEGCYHGHADSFLISAGSGAVTMGTPDSPGVTAGVAKDTLTAPYNNLQALENLIVANENKIAAMIIEPVVGNMGCVIPHENYLQAIRKLCDKNGIILIFDEVMTGFRLAKGGASELFGVKPDLVTLGKIIGGGMPVGAYGGKKELMNWVSPVGKIYQAGTLSGNPIAMTAGLALLGLLKNNPQIYSELAQKTEKMKIGMQNIMQKLGLNYTINQIGSMMTLFFTSSKVTNFETAKTSDLGLFAKYFQAMLAQGIYLPPSQFESWFVSTSITDHEIERILAAHENALQSIL